MSEHPQGTGWYFADVVLEIQVEGDSRNVVQVNTHLLRAESAEQAFEKAICLGRRHESDFANQHGQEVRIIFRGLAELLPIYEDLQDGAEIWYKEKLGVSEKEIGDMVLSKHKLTIFRQPEKADLPDYLPAQVWAKAPEESRATEV